MRRLPAGRQLRGFIYSSRDVWLPLAQSVLLYPKHVMGIRVGLPLYFIALSIAIAAQLFRT